MSTHLKRVLARNVKREREARGWSQAQLAERLRALPGFGQQVISKIENGQRMPRDEALEHLADALGMTVSQLLSENSSTPLDHLPEELAAAHRHLDTVYLYGGQVAWRGLRALLMSAAEATGKLRKQKQTVIRRAGRRPIALAPRSTASETDDTPT